MKNRVQKTLILAAILSLLAQGFSGYTTASAETSYKIAVVAPSGSNTSIVLPQNSSSTGFIWQLDTPYDDSAVKLIDHGILKTSDDNQLIGSTGGEIWTFRLNKPGQTIINAQYIRPWDSAHPAATATITIKSENNGAQQSKTESP